MIFFNKHNYYVTQNQFPLKSTNLVLVPCEMCSTEMCQFYSQLRSHLAF